MSALFLITTPLGNLGEFTPRAIEVLKSADKIYCENTTTALRLLTLSGITGKPLKAIHQGNEAAHAKQIASEIAAGANVAYMSEAGVPGISDPGFRIVREIRKNNISQGSEGRSPSFISPSREGAGGGTLPVVQAIGVPSAFLNALAISGLPTDSFLFAGFPPPKSVGRQKFFKANCAGEATVVFYESCHRLQKSIADLKSAIGEERVVSLSSELTKLHENTQTAPLGKITLPANPKGEWVICVAKVGYEL